MLFSQNLTFSDRQLVTSTTSSTNTIDLGVPGTVYGADSSLDRDLGPGIPIPLLVQVVEDFVGPTNIDIQVQVSDDESFTTSNVVLSQLVLVADLIAGKQVNFQYVPHGVDKRYLRINYILTGGAASTGAFTAGITMGNQSNG